MIPIKFNEANNELFKPNNMTDEECKSLWIFHNGLESISCWKLSFKERLKALIFGNVWLCVAGSKHPPVWIQCKKTVFKKGE